MVSNCRHPMTMRLGAVGSTAMVVSLAASPVMLWPAALVLTWTNWARAAGATAAAARRKAGRLRFIHTPGSGKRRGEETLDGAYIGIGGVPCAARPITRRLLSGRGLAEFIQTGPHAEGRARNDEAAAAEVWAVEEEVRVE